MTDDESKPKISQQLVMTPQLQMAIKMLSMSQDELFALVSDWSDKHPGAIAPLEAGDPVPVSQEEQDDLDEHGIQPWTWTSEQPLPDATPRPDVWVFGNPPQARANPAATPRIKAIFDDAMISRSAADVREASWLARAVRQRAKTMEKVIATLLTLQPQLAIATEPDKLPATDVRDIAKAMGMHESTITRVATNLRYQTIHGVVQLVGDKKLKHRALW